MYNLENIQKKVENMLAYRFNFSDVDTMKKYVNQNFITDYEELLNQTIFEQDKLIKVYPILAKVSIVIFLLI